MPGVAVVTHADYVLLTLCVILVSLVNANAEASTTLIATKPHWTDRQVRLCKMPSKTLVHVSKMIHQDM